MRHFVGVWQAVVYGLRCYLTRNGHGLLTYLPIHPQRIPPACLGVARDRAAFASCVQIMHSLNADPWHRGKPAAPYGSSPPSPAKERAEHHGKPTAR